MLLKRAIFGVLALVAGVFAYILYNTFDSGRSSHAGLGGAVAASVVTPSDNRVQSTPEETPPPPATAGAATSERLAAEPAGESGPAASRSRSPSGEDLSGAAGDSLHANPPNGTAFGGKGPFQLYRQGELTWRLNTETGATCVIFATEAQWRRPEIYRSGCRGR